MWGSLKGVKTQKVLPVDLGYMKFGKKQSDICSTFTWRYENRFLDIYLFSIMDKLITPCLGAGVRFKLARLFKDFHTDSLQKI